MVSRREFMATSTSLAISLTVGGLLPAQALAMPAVLDTVVYDSRFPNSVAFARDAAGRGHRVRAIRGDVTGLWYDDLYHRWKDGPTAIAGLTTPASLFCLETIGNDIGLRLAFLAEHRIGAGGTLQHRLEGPAALVGLAEIEACGAAWDRHMSHLVSRCPAVPRERVVALATTPPASTPLSGAADLVSWVLAPVRRV